MEMNLRFYFNEEELSEIKRIISQNEKVPCNLMGKGIDSIALKLQDATEEMQEKIKEIPALEGAEKVMKYISVHGVEVRYNRHIAGYFPGAEEKYVFFDKDGKAIAVIQETVKNKSEEKNMMLCDKFNLKKIDSPVEMYHETCEAKRIIYTGTKR